MKLKFWLSTTVTLLSLPFAGAALADATLSDGTFNNVTSTANFSVKRGFQAGIGGATQSNLAA